jgi:adenylate cyclase
MTESATFLFADIAGFTALTEAHGDEQAADLVADFCAAIRAELPPLEARTSRRSAMRSC